MNAIISLKRKIDRRLARFCARQRAYFKNDSGVVCFTFDDVPHSACEIGGQTLEKYNARGTFYVCGASTDVGDFHTQSDLLRMAANGHELGCHGFAHKDYQAIESDEILEDIHKNRIFFEQIGCRSPQNFAYPFGHVNPTVKRIAAREFMSLRGIQGGINHSEVDLALLKAFPLYEHLWTQKEIARVVERNSKLCGLLIFFTHRVKSDPGEFDCSPSLLEFAVRCAAQNNVVATIGSGLKMMTKPI